MNLFKLDKAFVKKPDAEFANFICGLQRTIQNRQGERDIILLTKTISVADVNVGGKIEKTDRRSP